jgi:hypothetical protein
MITEVQSRCSPPRPWRRALRLPGLPHACPGAHPNHHARLDTSNAPSPKIKRHRPRTGHRQPHPILRRKPPFRP